MEKPAHKNRLLELPDATEESQGVVNW